MNARSGLPGILVRGLACTAFAAAVIAGCSTGPQGPAGPAGATGPQGPAGPPGPTGPVSAVDISTAASITATITSVTGGATPTINFKLSDDQGNALAGLQFSTVSFGIAQLQPAAGDGTSTQWVNYITSVAKPATGTTPAAWGTTNQVRPGLESGSTNNHTGFVDHGDGTYSYTFQGPAPYPLPSGTSALSAYAAATTANYAANPLPTPSGGSPPPTITIAYSDTLPHRVGLEIRGTGLNPTNNAVYDYLPSTGATTGFATRNITGNAECNACHAKLSIHGGPRIDVGYCVICHNTGNTDPSSGNSLDFKVLVHKIHMGASLKTVVAAATPPLPPGITNPGYQTPTQGVGYVIWGFGNSVNNFNAVLWPQDQRNCTTCHNTNDASTPDAINYANVPYSEACTTCHDDVNTVTGIGHSAANVQATNAQCINCHGPNANVGPALTVVGAHVIQQYVNAGNYQFQVVSLVPLSAPNTPDTTACPAAATPPVPAGTICPIPQGDYVRATIKVVDGSGNTLSLGGPNNPGSPASPGFDATNYMPPTSPLGNGTTTGVAPSLSVDVAFTNGNFTNPIATRSAPSNGGVRTTAISIKFLSFQWANGAPSYTAPNAVAPPAANADGSYTADATTPIPPTSYVTLVGINGNVSGSVFIEGRAVTNIAPTGQPAEYWVTPVTTAGPVAFPISLPAGVTTPAARRVVVDIKNCDLCHNRLSWHTWARNDNALFCTACHNPEYVVAANAGLGTTAGPLDFKFFIHGLHSATYKYGSHDFTSTAPWPTPTSFMNRTDLSSNPILFPWTTPAVTANPALASTATGSFCENCHVTGGNTYYPVDATQVFSTSINAGTLPDASDDIAITPNVSACGACHTDSAAQSHMGQNGGVTAAMGLMIKNADGSTKAQYQGEACPVCHGPGSIADVKVMHKVATFPHL